VIESIKEWQKVNAALLQPTKGEKKNQKISVIQHCLLASLTQDTRLAEIKT
jgi:hypothetical protein